MLPKVLKIATGVLSIGSSCYIIDSTVHHSKTAKWSKSAEVQFWRASYAAAPVSIPKGTKLFKPRMDFPSLHNPVDMPWKGINFVEHPGQYLQCLLRTCLDSNLETDFDMSGKKENVW